MNNIRIIETKTINQLCKKCHIIFVKKSCERKRTGNTAKRFLQNDFELLKKPVPSFCQRQFKLTVTFLLFRGRILTLNNKILISTKYHMFVIINISSNLLQTLSSFLTNNSKCYVTKNGKRSSCRKYHNVMSLKNITIFEKKDLTENNNSNDN